MTYLRQTGIVVFANPDRNEVYNDVASTEYTVAAWQQLLYALPL